MAEQEKWDLSRDEIERRLQKLKTDPKQQEKTRGGRSSGQGVKLLSKQTKRLTIWRLIVS